MLGESAAGTTVGGVGSDLVVGGWLVLAGAAHWILWVHMISHKFQAMMKQTSHVFIHRSITFDSTSMVWFNVVFYSCLGMM